MPQHSVPDAKNLQRQTLRLYGELVSRRESYAGQLVFCCGEACVATGLPAAVSIAGGATLALDADAAAVKAIFRQGGVDFVVNTLDEALRTLKNQIRQGAPLSVALVAEPRAVLTEMVERGVLPDLQVGLDMALRTPIEAQFELDIQSLEEAGMQCLRLFTKNGIVRETEQLSGWLGERDWLETAIEPVSASGIRGLDEYLLALLPDSDTHRRRWIERISHYQRASPGDSRVVWLTAAERANVTAGGGPKLVL